MKRLQFSILVGTILLGIAPACRGQNAATFFLSRAAWEAATSVRALHVNFDEPFWPMNQVLGGDWTLNGLTFRGNAGTIGSAFFPNIYVINPSPLSNGALTANGDEDIDITPGQPRSALAFDISVNSFGPVVITVFDTGGELLGTTSVLPGTLGFFGVTSTTMIGRLNFRSIMGAVQNSLLDNIYLGDANPSCPADFNQDGTLDPDDLADFIGAFFAVPSGAGSDFNNDGTTDPDDLADYISAFFAGCP